MGTGSKARHVPHVLSIVIRPNPTYAAVRSSREWRWWWFGSDNTGFGYIWHGSGPEFIYVLGLAGHRW